MAQPELNPRKYLIYLLFFKHINILTMGLLLFSTTVIYLYFSWKYFLSTRFFFSSFDCESYLSTFTCKLKFIYTEKNYFIHTCILVVYFSFRK